MEDNVLKYDNKKIIPSCKNDFYKLLKSHNTLIINGKNEFNVGKTVVKDNQTFFGVFL